MKTTLNGAAPLGGLAVATATGGMFGAVTATGTVLTDFAPWLSVAVHFTT